MALTASKKLPSIISKISFIVFDFDGVFTDNGVYVSESVEESVRCSRYDGMGISLLHKAGVRMAVISTEVNSVVAARCKKLNLECIHGVENKLEVLKQWISKNNIDPEGLVFTGNDINDSECIRYAACGVAVADSHPDVLCQAKLILTHTGGYGAVRELAELVLKKCSAK